MSVPQAVALLLLSMPRCRAKPQPPQLDLPATFWADLDDPAKDILSPRTRCPPSKTCPPVAREASDTASALIRYCPRASTAGAAVGAGAADGASEWTRCSIGQSSDWLLLQPFYKADRIVHRFEHLFPFARQDGKHLQSLPNWAKLAPYPREWITLVCAPSGSTLESDAPLDIYHEVDDASAWGSRTEGYPKSTEGGCSILERTRLLVHRQLIRTVHMLVMPEIDLGPDIDLGPEIDIAV